MYQGSRTLNLNTKSTFSQKTTTDEEEKRYKLIKKLISQSVEQFREIDINDYDLNITEHFQELEYIDDAVTPLIYCAHYGLKEICKCLLLSKSIDVDMETANNKQTPLTVACMCGNYEIIRLLVLAKAQVNKPNSLNYNPLAVTIFRLVEEPDSFENRVMCFRIAEYLAKNGAQVNWIIDKAKGHTLLHYFCSLKIKMNQSQKKINLQVIQFLINQGADPFLLDLNDENCFDLVVSHFNISEIQPILHSAKTKKLKSTHTSKKNPIQLES